MILQLDDWKFDIDMARTMEYSAAEAAEHCDCAYCRNFYAAVDEAAPELRGFLVKFGVDIEAPEEMLPMIDGDIMYDPTYRVYGKILQYGQYEMQVGLSNAIARTPENQQDYFLLDCFEVIIPWVLDEPLEEVISPANEPSLLKKMWDRFLGKIRKQGLDC